MSTRLRIAPDTSARVKCLLLCVVLLAAHPAHSIRSLRFEVPGWVPAADQANDAIDKGQDLVDSTVDFVDTTVGAVQKGAGDLADTTVTAVEDLGTAVQTGVQQVATAVNTAGAALDQAGAVLDAARAVVADPYGTIRREVLNRAQEFISDALEQALGYENTCNTNSEKAAFQNGWDHAYYGKRLWDTRTVAMVVGSFFPATAGYAAKELMGELKAQMNSAMEMLEQAAKDLGEDLTAVLEQLIQSIIAGATSGNMAASVERDTFDIKGAIMRVDCSSSAAGIKLPSEGYFQLAFAFRIRASSPKQTLPADSWVDGAKKFATGVQQVVECGCINSYLHPKTWAPIPCRCYFWNDQTGPNCEGATFDSTASKWYKAC